ncbi:Ca-activated chloride channel family protein [Bosea sp. CRIB-10]|uniref:vWA domain-containing protein n=1 Tax=Bosea sp. CRIB-10 TaxID=378404 RepID=UPI0008E5E7F4|nr:VWA domain-containing protein [Bosea sp. CRIB-10]SFD66668.1 Ca-activated chloride channel family protein [Bosea sp. CRIB-10]
MIANLSAFHFERPPWLLVLLPAALLWLLERRDADPLLQWRRVIDPVLLPHLIVGGDRQARIRPGDWLLLTWLVAAIAVAGPAWQREPSPFAQAKPPVAVVLKVTPSMLTQDLAPTRLDRARQKLADILAAREGAATALIAYSGSAHLVLPATPDSAVVLDLAKALSPQIMPKEGDDLAGAITLARRALADSADGGSILVMADTVSPEAITALAEEQRIAATLLAMLPVGTDTGTLSEAARAIGARLVPATIDQADVTAVVGRLDSRDAAASVAGDGSHWREAGYWLVPLLALLTLAWFRRGWVLA